MGKDTIMFAVLGDIHGHFDTAWCALDDALHTCGVPAGRLDAIFAVGDVEPLRSVDEMGQVHGPAKYRELGCFVDVVKGTITFPAPLYFIGGNHEPWPSLDADGGLARHGGAWAPGVTFLGRAGLLEVAGLQVAFLSGIHSPVVSRLPAADRPLPAAPKKDLKRRTYWVDAELDAVRKAGRRGRVDLLLTHDWPAGIGVDRAQNPTGCEHVRSLVEAVQPTVSCHGHMHHRHSAAIGDTAVCCLGHIRSGTDAVGVFARHADGTIDRLH